MKKSKLGTKPVAAKKPAKTHKRVAKMTLGQGLAGSGPDLSQDFVPCRL